MERELYIKPESNGDVSFLNILKKAFGYIIYSGKNGIVLKKEMVPDIRKRIRGYQNKNCWFSSIVKTNNSSLLDQLRNECTELEPVILNPEFFKNPNSMKLNECNVLFQFLGLDLIFDEEEAKRKFKVLLNSDAFSNNLIIHKANSGEINKLKKQFDFSQHLIKNCWNVRNAKQDNRFKEYCEVNNIDNPKLVLHGSPAKNWYSIVCNGLTLRNLSREQHGESYGKGLYFSGSPKIAASYSKNRYIGVFEIAYGNPLIADYSFSGDSEMSVLNTGHDCLITGETLMSYIITYDAASVAIRYIIEL